MYSSITSGADPEVGVGVHAPPPVLFEKNVFGFTLIL